MPSLWLMRIVELVSCEKQFPFLDKACMEPEVEGTFLIVSGNVVGVGLEQEPGVALQNGTVESFDSQQVGAGVVAGLAVYLRRAKL